MQNGALLDPSTFADVERAVQEAERRTSGEIVPIVAARSSDYAGVRTAAAAVAGFAAGVVVLALPLDPYAFLPPVQVATFALAWWLSEWTGLLRVLLPATLAEERVERAARLAFVEQGLHETRERTGVLIYVSLLERCVRVIADRGIDARVEPGTWDGLVRELVAAIRAGRAGEGLVAAVRRCGDLLAASFPRRADDRNELADRLRA